MTQPYKTCPRCGQPAVLEMAQCRRCGLVYAAPPSAAFGQPASPGAVYPISSSAPESRARGSRVPAFVLCLLLFALLLLVIRGWRHRYPFRSAPSSTLILAPQTAKPPEPSALAGTASEPSNAGGTSLFNEKDSLQEAPTLRIRNIEADNMILILHDVQGHVWQTTSRNGAVATLQVPAGDYSVVVYSDNPRIQANSGDAVFRRYKEYEAEFSYGSETERLHLGD